MSAFGEAVIMIKTDERGLFLSGIKRGAPGQNNGGAKNLPKTALS
jgi:hypothetical protein